MERGGNDEFGSDPQLLPVALNGGPTETYAISATSPALDRNDDDESCGGTDQRGAPRPEGEDCDSGAYERVFCGPKLVNVVGTDGKDRLDGTNGDDGMLGLGGRDKMFGYAGNDALCGGKGNDTLKGGKGADFLAGQAGPKDKCIGGPGPDTLKNSCEFKQQ